MSLIVVLTTILDIYAKFSDIRPAKSIGRYYLFPLYSDDGFTPFKLFAYNSTKH